MEVVDETYRLTDSFPKEEKYGITAQMRRSAVSIPANIAEGHGRRTTTDYLRFLTIANASLRELETYLEVGEMRKYATTAELKTIRSLAEEVAKMLGGLGKALRGRVVP